MIGILAPAGAQEQLIAAVRCGADAVYFGGKHFNARRNAENFDAEALKNAAAYCRARNVETYVTVNTLVMDHELALLTDEADLLADAGVDAVIIQDLAVLRYFQNRYPGIRRFASTQTAVHNADGARRLMDLGFDSVVLARELTLSEMEAVIRKVPVRTEAFVHGAHCMSVSGMCYLSAMLGGRSGNRGLCAQPCRLDWRCGDRRFALSLKDMSLIRHIRALSDIGVTTLKIEGRMKRPEYVAAAVTACRQARAGESFDLSALEAVFSRSGFTDGYLLGKRDAGMFGYRTREDVTRAGGVLGPLAALYRSETPRVPVDMALTVTDEKSSLTLTDGAHQIEVPGPAPEIAQSRPLDAESARSSLQKTGGTPFYLRDFSASIAEQKTLSAAARNALRRDALAALLAAREAFTPYPAKPFAFSPLMKHTTAGQPALWARFSSPAQLWNAEAFSKLLLPAETLTPAHIALYGQKLIAQLSPVLFPQDEDAFCAHMTALRDAGLAAVYADNIYGVELGARLGLAVHGGALLNILNSQALAAYADMGLAGATVSFELSMPRIRALGGALERGIIAYGRLPLMQLRNCPVRAAIGCTACGGHGHLTDRMNVDFPLECHGQKNSTLLNSVPLHIAERDVSGVDHLLLYFTLEDRETVQTVTEDFILRRKTGLPHTGGLYYRELL